LLNNLDYVDGWTWFDEDGNALNADAAAAMTGENKAQAFIEGSIPREAAAAWRRLWSMCGLKDVKHFTSKYLKLLIEKIELTIPEYEKRNVGIYALF